MLQDPLKAIICNILNRAVYISKSLQREKQDQLAQFYIKVISFSSVATSLPRLWWALHSTMNDTTHVRSSHSQCALMTQLALGEAREKPHIRWKNEGDSDYELILFWIAFLFLYFPFLVVSSSEFEHAYFVALPSLHPFILDKQNSNLPKVEPEL